jgi:hypothetical protein
MFWSFRKIHARQNSFIAASPQTRAPPTLRQRRRRDIFVEAKTNLLLAPSGAAYSGGRFLKMSLLTELWFLAMENHKDAAPKVLIPLDREILKAQSCLMKFSKQQIGSLITG